MVKFLQAQIAAVLIASRWLMAPLYLGLAAAQLLIIIEFFRELVHLVLGFGILDSSELILDVLKLVDLILVGNLLLIMLFAGILTLGASFVVEHHPTWSRFMGNVDFAGLKLKVVASLTAIAAVGLLETYIGIEKANKSDVLWEIAILMAFVVSGVLLACMDRIAQVPHE
jgi:uncharacterized protein (TIGR00645 family)